MSTSNKPAVAGSSSSSRPSDAELTSEYNRRRTELSEIINKVSELERDADEHTLVLETLRQVNEEDPDRKCFRMVGGILVQKTVKDIYPQLQTNAQGIQSVIEQLSVTYKKREQEFDEFQKKHNIVVQRAQLLRTLWRSDADIIALQHRVEAISRNLRPSLQTHLRTMNDDMISIALGQARTMLAYENRKLQIYESVHAKIQKIPERASQEQNVVYVHPSQQQPSAASALTSDNPTVAPASAAPTSTAIASAVPTASAGMSSSVSAQSHGSASIGHGGGMAQSKFMATQAAIQAEMQAQREREERQRAQYAQARAYQHQKSASVVQQPAAPGQSGHVPEPQQAAAPTSGVTPANNAPVSPPRVMQVPPTPQSPLHNSSGGGGGASLPNPSAGGSGGAGPSAPGLTQSMFMPTPGGPINAPRLRSPPTSPLRHGRSASQQGGPGMPAQQGVHNGGNAVDPLLGSGAAHTGFGGRDQPASSYATLPGHVVTSNGTGTGIGTNGGGNSPAPYSAAGGAHMTQSVFLPGRNAQPGFRPAHANQSADERKRADARKAANLLAGAF